MAEKNGGGGVRSLVWIAGAAIGGIFWIGVATIGNRPTDLPLLADPDNAEIWAILAYIETDWPETLRARQRAVTAGTAGRGVNERP